MSADHFFNQFWNIYISIYDSLFTHVAENITKTIYEFIIIINIPGQCRQKSLHCNVIRNFYAYYILFMHIVKSTNFHAVAKLFAFFSLYGLSLSDFTPCP